jgi:hypothetical protein
MWTLAGAARGVHISNPLVSLHCRILLEPFPLFAGQSGSSSHELRRRSAQIISRLCLDVALLFIGDECQQAFEDESETEQMLRPVSEGQEGMRCGDLGGYVTRRKQFWSKSYDLSLQW